MTFTLTTANSQQVRALRPLFLRRRMRSTMGPRSILKCDIGLTMDGRANGLSFTASRTAGGGERSGEAGQQTRGRFGHGRGGD
jgi:hypothetical protein